ncbi:hypothetical protein ACH5RR_038040 [Cinchona calisaya]|uniref:Transposase n=1 Tax=Cinchona calisaya TaxID=153742 RepID=A0ABD2YA93_9GENT
MMVVKEGEDLIRETCPKESKKLIIKGYHNQKRYKRQPKVDRKAQADISYCIENGAQWMKRKFEVQQKFSDEDNDTLINKKRGKLQLGKDNLDNQNNWVEGAIPNGVPHS